jgi:Transglycosylase
VAFLILAGLLFAIVVFRFLNPAITPVMISEKLRGITFARHWVPLANISPNLPLAVIASEDGRFCDHWGVDWSAVKEAIFARGSNPSGPTTFFPRPPRLGTKTATNRWRVEKHHEFCLKRNPTALKLCWRLSCC